MNSHDRVEEQYLLLSSPKESQIVARITNEFPLKECNVKDGGVVVDELQ